MIVSPTNGGRAAVKAARTAFTLIEVMLAVAVMSLVIVVITGVFFAALRLRDHTMNVLEDAMPANQAVSILRRDLIGAVAPAGYLSGDFRVGILTEPGESLPVAIEMFTTTGSLRASEPWGDVQMVTYELKQPAARSQSGGSELYRSVTRNLLSSGTPEIDEQLLMSDVQALQFSCFDGSQWVDTWDTTSTNTNLPSAVRVTIQLAGASAMEPIEMVVPIVSQSPSNQIQSATAAAAGT